ncbi:MAG: GNAT family N-acetyltransferase [Aphanocapsa lilacina HA4352-LM1]|nr:GNAT family N-acetyltransferase [Aphanocapsa lilacina HA4352-LM1]
MLRWLKCLSSRPSVSQTTAPAITLSFDAASVEPIQLQQLFDTGAFWARNREVGKIERMLACSNPVVAAYAESRLVGFARATSDGAFRATIWDVVVHPDYQKLGLGRRLIEALLAEPAMRDVERVYLMTTFQQGFYEKLGFQRNASTTMLMMRLAEMG